MTTGEVSSKPLDRGFYCDFPRIKEDLVGYKNRYIYASRFRVDEMPMFDGELKYDNPNGRNFGSPFW